MKRNNYLKNVDYTRQNVYDIAWYSRHDGETMNKEILKKIIYDQHQVIQDTIIVDRDVELEANANYVLVGLRRVGKTTLLYKRAQD